MISILDVLGWQAVLGILIVGFILGFGASIGLAVWLTRRRHRKDDC